jgi:hypothetical protein
MINIHSLKELDKDILEAVYKLGGEARRINIIKELSGGNKDQNILNVTAQRSFNRLCDLKLLKKHDLGHQNVMYSLTKRGVKVAEKIFTERKALAIAEKLDKESMERWLHIGERFGHILSKVLESCMMYAATEELVHELPKYLDYSLTIVKGDKELGTYLEYGLSYFLAKLIKEQPEISQTGEINLHLTLKEHIRNLMQTKQNEASHPILKLPPKPRQTKRNKNANIILDMT